MKKHFHPMVPALGVLILLCAAYGFITWRQDRSSGGKGLPEEDTQIYMTDTQELTSVSWEKDGRELAFNAEDGIWYYKSDKDCPIRQYSLTTLADTLCHLKAERRLMNTDSPEAYGLDTPSARFNAVSADGSSLSILLGDQVPGTGASNSAALNAGGASSQAQYYATIEGSGRIYTVGTYLTETAGKGLYDFVETETLPYISGSDIQEITVTKDGRSRRFTKKKVDIEGNIAWYKDSADDDANRLEDNAPLNNLADAVSGLSFNSCVTYKAGNEELDRYGLSSPDMTLTWTYEKGETKESVSLMIGSLNDEGTGYYVKKKDSRAVNLVSKDGAERCLNAEYPQ